MNYKRKIKFESIENKKDVLSAKFFNKCPTFKMHGSKARIADEIVSKFLPKNTYVEPFLGRGNILFNLLNKNTSFYDNFIVNDCYMKFVHAIAKYSGDFSFIPEGPITREIYNRYNNLPDSLERTISECCLAYNGNIFGAGANITANSKNGHSKIHTIERLKKAKFLLNHFAEKIKLLELDYCDVLSEVLFDENCFVYLDPPYIGTKAFYPNIDEFEFLDILNSSKFSFAMSNYPSEFYDKNLKYTSRHIMKRNSTAKNNSGKSGVESNVLEVLYIYDNEKRTGR